MNNRSVVALVFFLCVILAVSGVKHLQRGRGSRSSGSRSSGSRSSGSSGSRSYSSPSYSSTTIISTPGYYGPRYYSSGYSPTCEDNCRYNAHNQQELNDCYNRCSQQNKTTWTIVGSILGGLSAIGIGISICCCCCKRNDDVDNGAYNDQNYQNYDPNDKASYLRREDMKAEYFRTQAQYRNQVCFNNMDENTFESYRNAFQLGNWSFFYIQKGQKFFILNYKIEMFKDGPFLYQCYIRGNDDLGAWTMKGYYLNTIRGIQLWFMKNYEQPDYAGQTQQFDKLMYVGAITRDNNYFGKWFYVGFENNPEYSADWYMVVQR